MAALDMDGDGELSAKEIENAAAALRTLDTNKDGKLTRDELFPAFREGGQSGSSTAELVTRMMAFDKNRDGKLSKAELPDRMQSLLATADTNKDGFVDKDELTKLAQQQAGRRKGGGPGMGRDGWNADEITSRVLGDRPRFAARFWGREEIGVFSVERHWSDREPPRDSFSQPSSPRLLEWEVL
jgi:Ca2+-binding EF-hand superfamily protein